MATPILDTSHSPHVRLHTVPLPAVRLADDGFWTPLRRGNVENGLPRLHALLEENGHMDNFRRLAGKEVARRGPLFTDSDLYKWIEAVGYVLQTGDHPDLRRLLDADIADIAAAQGDDGYLSTYFIEERAGERYQHLEYSHEMYCAGHLMQGAVAVARATGDDTLLQVACRFADHLDSVFGPGRNGTTDGHPEVELALIELYRHTRERRYLDLAAFLLSRPQSHANLPPIAQRESLVGHAVRSSYICCGGADLVMETGDPEMMANLQRLWQDLIGGKIYVTGGVGARYEGEAFGEPYELPNARAYAETCAQIGHFMWAFRMLLLTGEAQPVSDKYIHAYAISKDYRYLYYYVRGEEALTCREIATGNAFGLPVDKAFVQATQQGSLQDKEVLFDAWFDEEDNTLYLSFQRTEKPLQDPEKVREEREKDPRYLYSQLVRQGAHTCISEMSSLFEKFPAGIKAYAGDGFLFVEYAGVFGFEQDLQVIFEDLLH